MSEIENLHEKALVNSLLFESVGKSSAVIDAFSGWLLAGLAAVTTFLITNYASLPSSFALINFQSLFIFF